MQTVVLEQGKSKVNKFNHRPVHEKDFKMESHASNSEIVIGLVTPVGINYNENKHG